MNNLFDRHRNRFASFGVVNSLPGPVIDSLWVIIDMNLKGVVELSDLIRFELLNHDGKLTIHYAQDDGQVEMGIDLPFDYDYDFPQEVNAYDDGLNQTILLPTEIQKRG
jgi:hypothetical protein